jgi:phosphopentomutase
MFPRVLVVVLDSVGVGALPDADEYGDAGAATLQHAAEAVGGVTLPHLERLGLGCIVPIAGVSPVDKPLGYFGMMTEKSKGKDTTSGHWELMGLIVDEPFSLFPDGFPPEIVDPFVQATGRGILGNKPASGTKIVEELGEEHMRTGDWILYTSADSVFQLAAHEELVPLDELYQACQTARKQLDPWRVGRVIARPFVGQPGSFNRTYNRHDYSMAPDGPIVLEALQQAGVQVTGVGKIRDIYAGVGVDNSITTEGNQDSLDRLATLLDERATGLVFANLIDFDMRFGHRRNPSGYTHSLEEFDHGLQRLMERMTADDLLLITADHGCDPTYTAHTDHTREFVPVIMWSPRFTAGGDLGTRETFADLGATVADALGAEWYGPGRSFLPG